MQILKCLKLLFLELVEIGKYVEFWERFCVKGQTGKKKHCAESFPQYCKFSIINTITGSIFWQVFSWGKPDQKYGRITAILALVLFLTSSIAFLFSFLSSCQVKRNARWTICLGGLPAQFIGCTTNVSSSNVCTTNVSTSYSCTTIGFRSDAVVFEETSIFAHQCFHNEWFAQLMFAQFLMALANSKRWVLVAE